MLLERLLFPHHTPNNTGYFAHEGDYCSRFTFFMQQSHPESVQGRTFFDIDLDEIRRPISQCHRYAIRVLDATARQDFAARDFVVRQQSQPSSKMPCGGKFELIHHRTNFAHQRHDALSTHARNGKKVNAKSFEGVALNVKWDFMWVLSCFCIFAKPLLKKKCRIFNFTFTLQKRPSGSLNKTKKRHSQ